MAIVLIGKNQSRIKRRRLSGAVRGVQGLFVAWAAIIALVLQVGIATPSQAMAGSDQSDAAATLGALTALLGPNVALCLHEDGSAPGSPSQSPHHCCADCVLSQAAAHSAAIVSTGYAALPLTSRISISLPLVDDSGVGRPRSEVIAQPRARPSLV
jgi:hypothetical protein